MEPDSFHWCRVSGQEAVGTNWNMEGVSMMKCSSATWVPELWYRLPKGCGVSSLEIFRSHLDIETVSLLWVSLCKWEMGQIDPEVSGSLSQSIML